MPHQMEGAILLPIPRPSPPTRSAMRDLAWHKVARVSLKLSTPSSRLAAPRPSREATLAPAEGFAVRHSLEDLHTQFRWVPKTVEAQLTVGPQCGVDADQDAPMEDPVPVDAHRSQTRMQGTLLHPLDGAGPAPSNDLVRKHPDALFKWCTLTRDRHTGHLNGLFGILLGDEQGESGDAPLHRPG